MSSFPVTSVNSFHSIFCHSICSTSLAFPASKFDREIMKHVLCLCPITDIPILLRVNKKLNAILNSTFLIRALASKASWLALVNSPFKDIKIPKKHQNKGPLFASNTHIMLVRDGAKKYLDLFAIGKNLFGNSLELIKSFIFRIPSPVINSKRYHFFQYYDFQGEHILNIIDNQNLESGSFSIRVDPDFIKLKGVTDSNFFFVSFDSHNQVVYLTTFNGWTIGLNVASRQWSKPFQISKEASFRSVCCLKKSLLALGNNGKLYHVCLDDFSKKTVLKFENVLNLGQNSNHFVIQYRIAEKDKLLALDPERLKPCWKKTFNISKHKPESSTTCAPLALSNVYYPDRVPLQSWTVPFPTHEMEVSDHLILLIFPAYPADDLRQDCHLFIIDSENGLLVQKASSRHRNFQLNKDTIIIEEPYFSGKDAAKNGFRWTFPLCEQVTIDTKPKKTVEGTYPNYFPNSSIAINEQSLVNGYRYSNGCDSDCNEDVIETHVRIRQRERRESKEKSKVDRR